MSDETKPTYKRTAKSGRTSYARPVVLRENSRTRIELIPHFIDKRGEEALSLSIKKHFFDTLSNRWEIDKSASFSLSSEEVDVLSASLAELKSLLGASPNQSYITIPLNGDNFGVPSARKDDVVNSLIKAVTHPELSKAVAAHSPSEDFVKIMKSGFRVAEMRAATVAFQEMLQDSSLTEHDYQKWFDEHFWVFGNAYIAKDDVRRISRSDDTDMLLKQTASGLRDIVELKRPDFPVLKFDEGRNQYYFSQRASQAIGQCDRYLNIFSQEASQGLLDQRDVVAHHPRAIVVIGRSFDWSADKRKALHSLNSRMHGITVMTFDHVLQQAIQMLEIAGSSIDHDDVFGPNFPNFEDEVPF